MLVPAETESYESCWAPGCAAHGRGGQSRGLCMLHAHATKFFWSQHTEECDEDCQHEPTGRLYDALGMRLNVFAESGGSCMGEPGKCGTAICRYHLSDGQLELRGGKTRGAEETCALKLAERDGMTLDEVGGHLGITRERIRQIEVQALKRVAELLSRRGHDPLDIRQAMEAAARDDAL